MIDYDSFFSSAADRMRESAIRRMGMLETQMSDIISFAPGYPSPEMFAWTDFRHIARDVLGAGDGTVLQYGPTKGFAPLIEAVIDLLAGRDIRVRADEVLITSGSQQGLDLVARVLLDPGDVVLVELPTYTGAITAFRNAQATIVGIRQEQDGVDLEHLGTVLRQQRAQGRRVRFLYLVPNFQNPTGLLVSREKRKQLLEWSERENFLIVEDDPYGDIYFDEAANPLDRRAIKADDAPGRVVYLSSFSKTLAPGFRVAWMAAPAPLAAKFEVAKQAMDLCTGALDQRIVHEAWSRGILARRLPLLRAHYQAKHDIMADALRTQLGDLISWRDPRGGFFFWISLPPNVSAERLLARSTTYRVIFVVGSAFFVDGQGDHVIRLSFSAPTPDRTVAGIARLAKALRAELGETRVAEVTEGAGPLGGASR